MKREQLLARLRSTPRRDIAIAGLSALLLVASGFWGAAQFIRPAPQPAASGIADFEDNIPF